ncbi:MAG: DHH family phosphoesterase [Candidatus Magasanikbacteria bacterium]|nr:DHH family phosphoesterase [Candidatus Magasanikbacteria bacterium]
MFNEKSTMQAIAEQIHNHLTNARKIVIVPHPNPDGDALGSVSALAEYLNNIGRDFLVYCPTPINSKLNYLPNVPQIHTGENIFSDHMVDTVVVLDSGDLRYAGIAGLMKNHPAYIINIDHHATNENYGHFNLVKTNASSTTEILYRYFEINRVAVSRHMATNLLSGLITDTDNFTNSATSPASLAIAGELVRLGANFKMINFFTQKDKTLNILRLWGAALSRLSKHSGLNLTYTYLKLADFESAGLTENDGDGLANFMNNIDGSNISLILIETANGKVKGSFRTTMEDTDVSALAKKLGGGGHKKAAGFNTEGTVEEVLDRILNMK